MNKEFFIANKRYIGAAVLFVVFVLVLVKCTGASGGESGTEAGTESAAVDGTYALTGNLQKDADEELTALIKQYYEAYATADTETLETLAQPLTDNEKSYIGAFADYYESFENITCYSMPGATEDSYLVSVCYDLKFYEVDTPAPTMDFFYVERDGKGNLLINNRYSAYNRNYAELDMDDNIYALIASYGKEADVVALQEQVQKEYEEAVKSDEKLANLIGGGTLQDVVEKWSKSIAPEDDTQVAESTESTEAAETTESTEQETQAAETEKSSEASSEQTETTTEKKTTTGKVKTLDICNVRAKPSTDADIIGVVNPGVKLKKLGTKGEWTKVKFQGQTGYIKSSLLKTVKKKS